MLDRFVDLPFSVALESVDNCRHVVLLVRCKVEIVDHFQCVVRETRHQYVVLHHQWRLRVQIGQAKKLSHLRFHSLNDSPLSIVRSNGDGFVGMAVIHPLGMNGLPGGPLGGAFEGADND